MMWERPQAVQLIQDVREIALKHNYHVCLGGSVLHVGRSDNDVDIYFLPMHGTGHPSLEGLLGALDIFWGFAEDMAPRDRYPTERGYVAAKKLQWKLDLTKRIDFWVLG
jgi:hypothetical protein